MSTINSVNSSTTDTSTTKTSNNQSLSQEDFFALLSTQLSMQDPSNPVDNDQMIAQMASFSTVDGIGKLNDEISNLNTVMTSSQALQASGLVGQKVLVPSGTAYLSADEPSIRGIISTSAPINAIKVSVQDATGQVVRTFTVDGSAGGNIDVDWDGMDNSGNAVAAGQYTIKANGVVDGKSEDLYVSTYGHVSSVSLNSSSGAVLNVRGIGGVALSDVLAVSEG
ncbi:flagellar hook assembly protein FlgD [Shewanella fodinae]|uniref:Basal-body rod modification protein FlgD n=1 Tax=Shewanella fodinae TaxID=552357 RepID=A0A4R2FCH8_9GAMM|nr:flagellar hook assembly protein FlgD [Shewanella sp. 4t3-1-2LB]TCN85821.1 flagellar basal-body rod modification protein FlgD [Shewanella fodinae]